MAVEEKQRVVNASNINFTIIEAGVGPLVLCLHGFPDTAHSFRYQMPVLAEAGFHVVAPFMRGYYPTEPASDGRYDPVALADDVLALIEALGEKEAILFGHDWGAVAAYGAAAAAPAKIRRLVTAAVPYGTSLFAAWINNSAQQRRSWYMFFFQAAFAEVAVARNDFEFLEKLWNEWSPRWGYSQEDLEALKTSFRGGSTVKNAIQYYRATLGPAFKLSLSNSTPSDFPTTPINVPAMIIQGRDDGCIGVEMIDGMAAHFPLGLRVEIVRDAGHFVHQERPEQVNSVILDFLRT